MSTNLWPRTGYRVTVIVRSDDGHQTKVRRRGNVGAEVLLAQCIAAVAAARDSAPLSAVAKAATEAANEAR